MADEPCQIVEEPFFTSEVTCLASQYSRIYDVVDGQYLICRKPTIGALLPGESDIYLWLTTPMGSTPSFRILYAYTDCSQVIHLLAIAPVTANLFED